MTIVAPRNERLPYEHLDREFQKNMIVTDPTQEGLVPEIPYSRLNMEFDYKGMYDEAMELLEHFIDDNEAMRRSNIDPARSPRMNRISLDLCKLDKQNRWITKNNLRESSYSLTPHAEKCPITMKFILNTFPHVKLHDFGFRILKPGGYLDRHIDLFPGRMSLSVALNNPEGAVFLVEEVGKIPIQEGEIWMINTENYIHKVENRGPHLRVHLCLNGEFSHSDDFRSLVLNSFDRRNPDYDPNFKLNKIYPAPLTLENQTPLDNE